MRPWPSEPAQERWQVGREPGKRGETVVKRGGKVVEMVVLWDLMGFFEFWLRMIFHFPNVKVTVVGESIGGIDFLALEVP